MPNLKSFVLKVFPYSIICFIREVRINFYYFLSPFEQLLGTANPSSPPLYLKRYIGSPKNFYSSGENYCNYLKDIAELKPDEKILDIGCGCGSVALPLAKYLNNKGEYLGIDIFDKAIKWCLKNIAGRYQNFEFLHIDVKNPIYTRKGKDAKTYRFQLKYNEFNVILVKSVFTHMGPEEVDNYLGEIYRILKKGARCLSTFFVLNNKQAQLRSVGLNQLDFKYGDNAWRYCHKKSPFTACAFNEEFINQLTMKHKLFVKKIYYGTWTGRPDGVSFQDIILLEKT